MPGEVCLVKCIWVSKVEETFNCIEVGQVFGHSFSELVVGHEDGVVRIYDLPTVIKPGIVSDQTIQCCCTLESKGGPIQVVAVQDITKLHGNDIIVADSRGMLTVFSHEQILNRKAVSEHCIHCLQVQHTALGGAAVITGDNRGHITAFSPYTDMWRIRLADVKNLKGISSGVQVSSLLSVRLQNSHGESTDYVMATDNARHLYFLHQGQVVLVLNTPVNITAMCCGKFVQPEDLESLPSSLNESTDAVNPAFQTQVALGSEAGTIYLMTGFQVYGDEFANIRLPITQLRTLAAADTHSTDSILCAGNFEGLSLLREGKEVARYKTSSWVKSMVTADIDKDGMSEVLVGCKDNSIHGLKVCFS